MLVKRVPGNQVCTVNSWTPVTFIIRVLTIDVPHWKSVLNECLLLMLWATLSRYLKHLITYFMKVLSVDKLLLKGIMFSVHSTPDYGSFRKFNVWSTCCIHRSCVGWELKMFILNHISVEHFIDKIFQTAIIFRSNYNCKKCHFRIYFVASTISILRSRC